MYPDHIRRPSNVARTGTKIMARGLKKHRGQGRRGSLEITFSYEKLLSVCKDLATRRVRILKLDRQLGGGGGWGVRGGRQGEARDMQH